MGRGSSERTRVPLRQAPAAEEWARTEARLRRVSSAAGQARIAEWSGTGRYALVMSGPPGDALARSAVLSDDALHLLALALETYRSSESVVAFVDLAQPEELDAQIRLEWRFTYDGHEMAPVNDILDGADRILRARAVAQLYPEIGPLLFDPATLATPFGRYLMVVRRGGALSIDWTLPGFSPSQSAMRDFYASPDALVALYDLDGPHGVRHVAVRADITAHLPQGSLHLIEGEPLVTVASSPAPAPSE